MSRPPVRHTLADLSQLLGVESESAPRPRAVEREAPTARGLLDCVACPAERVNTKPCPVCAAPTCRRLSTRCRYEHLATHAPSQPGELAS